jgi:DNA polymerase-3 subunit epsilon
MMFFPFDPSRYKAMVFFDVETTGLDYQHGQITQFAGCRALADGSSFDVDWYSKLRDGVDYPEEVQQITKISKKFLLEHGISEGVLARNVFDFLFFAQPVVLIAHNAQFDMLFVLELLKRYGHTMPVTYSVLDTITIARDRKEFPHKLIDVMNHYNHDSYLDLHRADADVNVLIDVFYSMLHEKNDINCYLDIIGIPPKKEVMGYCLPTISYKVQQWFRAGKIRPAVYVLPTRNGSNICGWLAVILKLSACVKRSSKQWQRKNEKSRSHLHR